VQLHSLLAAMLREGVGGVQLSSLLAAMLREGVG